MIKKNLFGLGSAIVHDQPLTHSFGLAANSSSEDKASLGCLADVDSMNMLRWTQGPGYRQASVSWTEMDGERRGPWNPKSCQTPLDSLTQACYGGFPIRFFLKRPKEKLFTHTNSTVAYLQLHAAALSDGTTKK